MRQTRPISWMTIAAEGGKADIAKPLLGFSSAVFEIALPYRGDAYRVVYAVQLGDFTVDRLMSILNRLRARVEVKVKVWAVDAEVA